MKTPQFYIAARTKKKRWLAFCWALAAVVVFCTVYALILPGVSASRDTICGVEAHEHSALCYAPDENATLTALPEEEREAVQCLITQIDGLPAPTELEEALAARNEEAAEAEAETDAETATETETDAETATPKSRDDFIADLSAQIAAMEEAFLALSPAQQETVENWPKLMETKQQLCYLDYGERIAALNDEDEAAKEELKLALDDAHAAAALNDATYSELMALLLPPEPAAEDAETDSEHEAASEDEAPTEETETTGEEVTSEEGAYSPQVQSTTGNAVSDSSGVQPQASTPQAVTDPKYTKDDGPLADNKKPSDLQVDNYGGTNATDDVSVSKTIRGTDLENVFDITLKVENTQKIEEVTSEPDMAVVIVMDISNTMNDNFGNVTRYAAAMEAAGDFLDKFTESNTLGVSKVGYVAFNTDAHEIFGLQPCVNKAQADALKNTMRTKTGKIINAEGYSGAHNRFTNIEGGLKRASDMLEKVSNQNKYIVLLTDGFPTTYLNNSTTNDAYEGYDPYCSSGEIGTDGVFYDNVEKLYCKLGTSYSDKAAIRARTMATSIKKNGTEIFSIGVDIGGQTIAKYSKLVNDNGENVSIVDRTGKTYEIGSADSADAYKSWLKSSIGSGYYYDSTDSAGLKKAYEQIFAKIKEEVETASQADWVACDPMQAISQTDVIEFIGFYNHSNILTPEDLNGKHEPGGENTATFDSVKDAIQWDLKNSGYTQSEKAVKLIIPIN